MSARSGSAPTARGGGKPMLARSTSFGEYVDADEGVENAGDDLPSPASGAGRGGAAAAAAAAAAAQTRKRKYDEVSSSNKDKENGDTTSEDLTKNMDAPLAQPHVEEVHMPKNVNLKKETTDYQPYRNGTLIDLDEENEDKKVRRLFLKSNF